MRGESLIRLVQQVTAPLRHRVANAVSVFVVDAVNDAAKRQGLRVRVLADEVLDPVEHYQPGGLTHVALPGAEGVLLCVGGQRSHPLAVGVSNREARPTGLLPGETGLYSATAGTGGLRVLLAADGTIELTPVALVGVPKVTIVGDLEVTGEVTALAATPGAVGLSTHLHPTATGPTSPPTGGT